MRELYKQVGVPAALPRPIGIERLRHELAQRDQIIAEQCRDAEVHKILLDNAEKQIEMLNRYIIQLRNEMRRAGGMAMDEWGINETVKVLCG